MDNLKYISLLLNDIYEKKYIVYKKERLKSINFINIVDTFLNKYLLFNKDSIKLSSSVMKKLYGGSYLRYIEYLIEKDFIYLYKNYSVGNKSKCYKLTNTSKNIGYLSVNIQMPKKLLNKLEIINTNLNMVDEYIKNKLISDLYSVNINLDKSLEWINENIKDIKAKFINETTCNKIYKKDLYYSFDNYGRFHTNFTILKKEIRNKYLKIDNENIKEIDISNSQPFFLYLLMKEKGFVNFEGFDNDVLSGKIYEKILNNSSEKITRKEAKINVYSILFGRTLTKNYWHKLFNNLYPSVYEWISNYKKENKNYKIIAQQLQSLESNFMFKKLIPNIINKNSNIKIITIHDSVIVQEQYYEDVKFIFLNSLTDLISNN